MAEAKATRLSLKEVQASMKRMRTEGERLVGRIRRDAGALAARSRRETMNGFLTDARRLQTELRKRAEQALRDIEASRARILSSIEEQAGRLVERVVKGLNVVTHEDVADIRARLAALERRLDALSKEKAA